MTTDLIQTWLKKNKSQRKAERYLEAGLSFVGGIVLLILTFWLAYFVAEIALSGLFSAVELVSGAKWKLADGWFLMISGVFVVLLFVQYWRMDPWSWGRYAPKENDTGTPMQREFEEKVRRVADAIAPNSQAPTYADCVKQSGMASKAIADVLVIGPRLLLGTFRCFREIRQINSLEVDQCAPALAFIYERAGTVTYEEFCQGSRGEQLKPLKQIEGISFTPVKIWLSDELMAELKDLK